MNVEPDSDVVLFNNVPMSLEFLALVGVQAGDL
jgi:hypothetical protein